MGKIITYNFVNESFKNEGYTLLSENYIDAHSLLYFICPHGHKHKITWCNWKQGHRCGKCEGNIEITYEQVKQSFEKEGYQLLSKEYINAHKLLEYICPNKHRHKIEWANWQNGQRCGKCCKNSIVIYEKVKQSFKSENYQLLSQEYITNKKLDYICPNGHKHKIIWGAWQQGQRCGKCNHKYSKPEKEIVNYIKNNYNGTIKENDRTVIKNNKTGRYLELDIWLPETRKAIEYNSIWWHKIKKDETWKDNYKKQWCKENNIDLMIIDDKWLQNKSFIDIQKFINN